MVYASDTTTNVVIVRGRIVRERTSGSRELFTVCSHMNKRDTFIHFECEKGMIPKHHPHALMCIEGHISSKRVKRNDRIVTQQYFVADKVELEKTMTEKYFGVKGKFFENHCADVFLNGIVVSSYEEDGWCRYTVNVGKDNKRDITVKLNAKKQERQQEINVGDRVCACCKVISSQKELGEKVINMESVMVDDLAVVKTA